MAAFIGRAVTDIRVNSLKSSRETVMAALREEGIASSLTPYAAQGLRIEGDAGNLSRSTLFESGCSNSRTKPPSSHPNWRM